MEFKAKYLLQAASQSVCYRYLDAFHVDLKNGCVRFGFECMIPGSTGNGTQFLFLNPDGMVNGSTLEWRLLTRIFGLGPRGCGAEAQHQPERMGPGTAGTFCSRDSAKIFAAAAGLFGQPGPRNLEDKLRRLQLVHKWQQTKKWLSTGIWHNLKTTKSFKMSSIGFQQEIPQKQNVSKNPKGNFSFAESCLMAVICVCFPAVSYLLSPIHSSSIIPLQQAIKIFHPDKKGLDFITTMVAVVYKINMFVVVVTL